MNQTFNTPLRLADRQNHFSNREVGISHPDVHGFIKLCDNGDIEICAGEGLVISMHPKTGTITFVADHINFITRSNGGLKWNHVAFNERATSFREPTFIAHDPYTANAFDTYEGTEDYLKGITQAHSKVMVSDGAGNKVPFDELLPVTDSEIDYDALPEIYFRDT